MDKYKKYDELRDLFIILLLIFLCYHNLKLYHLQSKVSALYVGEHIQNEINSEFLKRLLYKE